MGVIKKFPSLEAHFLADAGLPAPAPAALSGGLRCFLRPSRHTSPWTSRRGSDQVPHTHQIVGGRCPGKHPGDTLPAPMPYLAHQSYRLHPPKDFFHPLAFLLTERVAGMARGSLVDGAAAVRIVLGHMRRGAARPHLLHPVRGVVVLVGAHRDAPRPGAGLHHLQRRLAFRRPAGQSQARLHHQPVPVLHQRVTQVAQLGFLPLGLFVDPRVRIGGRLMRLVRALLAPEIHRGVAGIVRGRRPSVSLFFLKLFWLAQASISVPSTVKCSSLSRSCSRAIRSTSSKNALATSPFSNRSRFLEYTVASQTGSSMFKPTNHRNSKL